MIACGILVYEINEYRKWKSDVLARLKLQGPSQNEMVAPILYYFKIVIYGQIQKFFRLLVADEWSKRGVQQ